MARAVFCARALGLSKVLCSMDTISSYGGAEAAEVAVVFGLGKETQQGGLFSGRLNGGFQGLFCFRGLVGIPGVLENGGG